MTQFEYRDSDQQLETIISAIGSPDEATQSFEYDDTGNQTAIVDGNGNRTTFTYDVLNRLTRITEADPDGAGPLQSPITNFTYDVAGNLLTITDAENSTVRNAYDSRDRLISTIDDHDQTTVFAYDSEGNLVATTDPLGFVTQTTYDTRSRLIETIDPEGGATTFTYDADDNLLSLTDPVGNITRFAYDARNRLTEEVQVFADSDEAVAMGGLTGLRIHAAELGRGSEGNVDSTPITVGDGVEFGPGSESTLRTLGETIDFSTDQITFIFPDVIQNDGTGMYLFSDADQSIPAIRSVSVNLDQSDVEIIDVDQIIEFADDWISIDLLNLNLSNPFFYAGKSLVIDIEFEERNAPTRYHYDTQDNLTRKIDRNGRETRFVYDDLDRLLTESWIDPVDGSVVNQIGYEYDQSSNLLSISDAFSSLSYSYDDLNRVQTVDNTGTPGALPVLLTYAYDDNGNVVSVTDTIDGAAGTTTGYDYDALDRTVSVNQSGSDVSDKLVDLVYNQIGQFDSITRYSDLQRNATVANTEYQYDELNRLTDLDHTNAADAVLAFYDFEYDASSRISQIADIDGVTDYAYDDRSQLTGADRAEEDDRGDESYSYDANGNRVTSHRHDNGYVTGPQNRLLSDGTFSYAYDAEGNMTRRTNIGSGEARGFIWDHRNRLIRVTDFSSGGIITQDVEYRYDALDRRIEKRIDSDPAIPGNETELRFVYDREDIILDVNGLNDQVAVRYFHGPQVDQVLAQERSEQTQWLLTDHLGTTREVIANVGSILNHLVYDSFGNVVSESDAGSMARHLFTGREYDIETELNFYRSRYYLSGIGQFVSEDRIGFRGKDPNLYGYVFNSPHTLTDPFGLRAGDDAGVPRRSFRNDVKEALSFCKQLLVGRRPTIGPVDPIGDLVAENPKQAVTSVPAVTKRGMVLEELDDVFKGRRRRSPTQDRLDELGITK
ncbi:YD repeat-containing protein [Rhodopirellula maiorica SM1]|uniref:YD repeat-containing protein n=1 Tax=Rhodopirellula maiorica SM1 TaxID=1265738 RepID=M5RU67_9BACT|nr:YD repeat-containing protein [Rhodopirellula maiorica SM1]